MVANLSGWHLLIVLAIVLLLFGAPKLPALARSVGQSMRILRKEVQPTPGDAALDDGSGSSPAETSAAERSG
ncbi:twin-arginine translocase TatA/TatE family subunit [Agromyces sp. NPDC058104]|uniref:twin-arginine translocase TatA/TatE family subunit n=1 Tax=Agromyces sp. NPDC058104 TaxID=3346342 RepID=UPI0036D96E1D